jgi:hypothetical protein
MVVLVVPDYSRIVQVAKRLLKSAGRPIKLRIANESSFNASRPWEGPSSGDDRYIFLDGVFVEPDSAIRLGTGIEFDDLVSKSEQIIIVSPGETEFQQSIEVLDDGIVWGITNIQILRPGLVTLLAFIGIKR